MTTEPTVTELINFSNSQLRKLYDEAAEKDPGVTLAGLVIYTTNASALTTMGAPSRANTWVSVLPHQQANELVRQTIRHPDDSRRMSVDPVEDVFVVYVIVKDRISRFQKPVREFLARTGLS